jgi:phosphatidylglycerol:prolipoprotein diacylglycerol transferase
MPIINVTFDPIIARLGPFELGWHGIFTALAVMVAVWLGVRRAAGVTGPTAPLDTVVTWAVVGGLVGARLFHVLDHLPDYLADPLAALAIWQGGIAVYGAFLGGLVGGLLAARRAQLPVWPLLDAAAPALLVGQAIGRLGCLSNGDAWGAPTGGAWGIVYWHPHDLLPAALLGVPTHPYPLYEIGAELLLLVGLWLVRRQLARPGTLFLVTVLGYAVIRAGLTFFRQETVLLWGLQEAQLVALATGLAAAALLVVYERVAPLATAPATEP